MVIPRYVNFSLSVLPNTFMRLSCLVNLILRVGDIELITKNLQPFLCGLISSNFSGKKNGYGETKMRNSACLKERCNLSLLVLLYHKNLLESKTTLNKVPAVLLRRIILLQLSVFVFGFL